MLIPVDASKQSTLSKYTGLLASMPSFLMWMTRHKHAHTEKVCVDFLQKLRRATTPTSTQRIGMVGFCWGGQYALRAGLEEHALEVDGAKVPLVDAVVAIHPSNLVLPNDVKKLIVPTSFAWGKEDTHVKIESKDKVEASHAEEAKIRTVPEMEHKVYEPGRHGFGVRGNPDDPQERECLKGTETQVLEWFKRWL